MLSSVVESVERIWRIHLTWTKALSFRKHLEKLGVVQTDLTAQFTFAKYIGKGAFSEVYLAQHVDSKTTVAAKVMKKPLGYPDANVDPYAWEEFTREVRTLSMAQGHENIMRLHGTYLFRTNDGSSGEGPCALTMITELLDISLLDLVKNHGKLPESSTKGVAESLLSAVAHLNSVGFVHRDIKVSNVMLRSLERGGIVLVDLGFGRETCEPEVFKSVVGTVGYLAPELFLEDTYVDLRYADVFSIGIVTLTCLVGRSVFQGKGKDGVATDRAKYFENLKCELNWDIPSALLSSVGLESLTALLEKDPSKRPLAADALRSKWYDMTFENCVQGQSLPEKTQRELAFLTAPRFRRCHGSTSPGDATVAENPVRKASPPDDGPGEEAPVLKPTPPPMSPTSPSSARPSPSGRRQTPRREGFPNSPKLAAAA
jgi:serine/threonine protein kinase